MSALLEEKHWSGFNMKHTVDYSDTVHFIIKLIIYILENIYYKIIYITLEKSLDFSACNLRNKADRY